MIKNTGISKKQGAKKIFYTLFCTLIFENYLLRVMSVQSFSFIRPVDKKLTWGGVGRERGNFAAPHEPNIHKKNS